MSVLDTLLKLESKYDEIDTVGYMCTEDHMAGVRCAAELIMDVILERPEITRSEILDLCHRISKFSLENAERIANKLNKIIESEAASAIDKTDRERFYESSE